MYAPCAPFYHRPLSYFLVMYVTGHRFLSLHPWYRAASTKPPIRDWYARRSQVPFFAVRSPKITKFLTSALSIDLPLTIIVGISIANSLKRSHGKRNPNQLFDWNNSVPYNFSFSRLIRCTHLYRYQKWHKINFSLNRLLTELSC